MTELRLPPLGARVTAGTLRRWLRQPGDYVKGTDPVAEVEADKGLLDITADIAGQIELLLAQPGDTVPVGAPLAIIREQRMNEPPLPSRVRDLPIDRSLWDRFFSVAPLILVGSKEDDGTFNFAPKHMAMPLGWAGYYCFVCKPTHRTYRNISHQRAFTVSFPRPSDVLMTSLAAAPRSETGEKPSLIAVPTIPARKVEGVLMEQAYVHLECTLHRIIDGFGADSLIIGHVVAASAHEDALRDAERDEAEQIFRAPLLAYLSPGRFAEIRETQAFPFHEGFSR